MVGHTDVFPSCVNTSRATVVQVVVTGGHCVSVVELSGSVHNDDETSKYC